MSKGSSVRNALERSRFTVLLRSHPGRSGMAAVKVCKEARSPPPQKNVHPHSPFVPACIASGRQCRTCPGASSRCALSSHARFVPALKTKWVFNVMSVFAFYSIMMTYFGVNFYLTGLHSYASGDKVVTPTFVYYSLAFVTTLAAASYYRNRKYKS